jgi:hypothetical protein
MEHVLHIFLGNCISSEIRSENRTDNGYLPCFRWLELPAELQKVFGLIKPAVLSNRH